jgi:hypothetical protein
MVHQSRGNRSGQAIADKFQPTTKFQSRLELPQTGNSKMLLEASTDVLDATVLSI